MSDFYLEEEESRSASTLFLVIGALAGFAAGVYVAERYGGFQAITSRIRERMGRGPEEDEFDDNEREFAGGDGFDEDEFDDDFGGEMTASEQLEERVLEAFRNDPILSERAIDIGALDEGIVELTGWVNADDESHHAVTITRGVPGVDTVINRLAVRAEEDLLEDTAARYGDGDPSLTEGHWEGQHVGTGRRRQGNSSEVDRHSDPRPILEDKSISTDAAFLAAADDIEDTAERRRSSKKAPRGGRTDGSPVAPTGVPKADHVADPLNAPQDTPRGD